MEYFILKYFSQNGKLLPPKETTTCTIIFFKRKNNQGLMKKNICSKSANGASSVAQDNEYLNSKDYNIVPTKLVNVFLL